jgi:rhamnulokinase
MSNSLHERKDSPAYGPPAEDRRALVAVDLGAESCRLSLLRWHGDVPEIALVHRFPNSPIQETNGLHWDLPHILSGVDKGLRDCAQIADEGIAAIGVDGWAVDYVRLDSAGKAIGNPFCYRDKRNVTAQAAVHSRISPDRLYELSGAQSLPINTLNQLRADSASGIDQNMPWVNLPEYVLHYLGGRRVSEYTNATHTELLGVKDHRWCGEIFSAAELNINAAPPLVKSGTVIGKVSGSLGTLPAFRDTRLIVPACHDTASAIAGIPAHGDDWAFISSGTWSLVGCVLDAPQTSARARASNFSNEGGVGGKTYFLKNVNGMWMIRQCLEHWEGQGTSWNLDHLLEACGKLPDPTNLIEVDEPDLLQPGNMVARINGQLSRAGKPPVSNHPDAAPIVASLIFHSLAARYSEVLQDLEQTTGKRFKRLLIVGGGSRNQLLNHLTARATGLEVTTGPTECATIGNFAAQLASLSGAYSYAVGVNAAAVAGFASLLADKLIATEKRPNSSIARTESRESERPSG